MLKLPLQIVQPFPGLFVFLKDIACRLWLKTQPILSFRNRNKSEYFRSLPKRQVFWSEADDQRDISLDDEAAILRRRQEAMEGYRLSVPCFQCFTRRRVPNPNIFHCQISTAIADFH